MPVPGSVTTRVVEGTYVDSEGTPQVGTVTFRVDQPLIATVESWGVTPTPVIAPLDANGSFSKTLMTSTDLDVFPSGFRYVVQERFNGGYVRTYSIDLPASGTPLDLPTASQYDAGDIGLAVVHSINGRTGIVQLAAADVGAIPVAQKAVANGVASLDSSGKLPIAQMPAPTAGVGSVDGRSGTVTLADLYAGLGHVHTFPVTSVNGLTGAVSITAASISALPTSQKGALNGVASLDATGHLLLAQFPEEAWVNVFDASSQAAMLALVANRSDLCRRTDLNQTFMLIGNDPTVLADWKMLLTPPDAVPSVNGHTGVVVLSAADVGAVASSARGAANGVASLDSGTLVPTAQIPGLPASKITSGLIDFLRLPTGSTSTTVSIGNHNHDTAYVAAASVGSPSGVASLDSSGRIPVGQMPVAFTSVTSVNGYTGLVVLAASDVGALSTTSRGANNGVASLDNTGVIPSVQIPPLPASKIDSGTFDFARIPTGTTSATVAVGNHTHSYVALSEKGAALGVSTLDSGGLIPIGQIPTGTSATTVALGSHNHDLSYIPLGDKGANSGVATLDGTGKVPLTQLPSSLGVASVNSLTGAVVLTAADVSAIPTSQKGVASGVATLDGSTLVPFAQLPTGTTSSTVAVGNHAHGAIKAITTAYVTSGDTTALANTTGTWTEVDSTKYRQTVAAASGDIVFIGFNASLDEITNQHFDVAFLVSGSPVRYLATGTSTPGANGNAAFMHSPGTYRTTGFGQWIVLGAGDVSGGLLTVTLMYASTASGGTIYASDPATIITLVNHGPAA